jgi:spore coat polysaccharide biosynthesis protein SpsF (cytidylyltransferase family)
VGNKTIAVVQARMSSRRLPGKVLCEIEGMPMLELVLRRIMRSELVSNYVVATSKDNDDDPIDDLASRLGIDCYRGSLRDVRSRFFECLLGTNAEHFVRITADCPFVDPKIMDCIIQKHIEHGADYSSNTIKRTFPKGLDVEVVKYAAFSESFGLKSNEYSNEHVTPLLIQESRFSKFSYERNPDLSSMRWTVDYLFDLERVRKIASRSDDIVAVDFDDLLVASASA